MRRKPRANSKPLIRRLLPLVLFLLVFYLFRVELLEAWNLGRMLLDHFLMEPQERLFIDPLAIRSAWIVFAVVLGFGLFFGLGLFLSSQFILPVESREERSKAFWRLSDFFFGRQGMVIFIKEGKVLAGEGELRRLGRGVMLVDHTSAVVLEQLGSGDQPATNGVQTQTSSDQTGLPVRVVGSGVAFIRDGEMLRGIADLRVQSRTHRNVRGVTRDGVHVYTDLSVTFTLGEPPEILVVAYDGEALAERLRVIHLEERLQPGEAGIRKVMVVKSFSDELDPQDQAEIHRYAGRVRQIEDEGSAAPFKPTPSPAGQFGLFPERVFAAVYSQGLNVPADRATDWTELPAFAAAEVFHGLLSIETFSELYSPEAYDEHPLFAFKKRFSAAMRNLGVLSFQFVESKDQKPLQIGQEYDEKDLHFYPVRKLSGQRILRSRGIKVLRAGFKELLPVDPLVEERRLEEWRMNLKREVENERIDPELQALRFSKQAYKDAEKELLYALSHILESGEDESQIAAGILQQLEQIYQDPSTHRLLPPETIRKVESLRRWFGSRGQNMPRRGDLNSERGTRRTKKRRLGAPGQFNQGGSS